MALYGAVKSPTFVRLAGAPQAGDSAFLLAQPVSGWQPGDTLVLPDSRQLPDTGNDRHTYLRLEERTVQGVSPDGRTITFAPALQFTHPGTTDENGDGQPDYVPHIANLTRNIVIRSENRGGTRGHVLFTNRARIDVRHVEFEGLGRTTFDDLHATTNHIGRYSLHVHHLYGPSPTVDPQYQFRLVGNAVHEDSAATPPQKWGITLHGSHYGLVQDNVVYNLGGAGIVTEDGSESFNVFDHNFVARITSNGGRDEHEDQPRGIAREGVGFWFRGPNNHVRNNVAANLGEDAGDVEASYAFKYNLVYLGTVRIPDFRGADTMVAGQYTSRNGNQLPLLEFDNNEAYGVVQGLTMWWLCSLSAGDDFRGQCGQSVVRNLVVWHAMRYAYYGYPGYNYVFDNARVYGDASQFGAFGNAIWHYGDYATVDHVTRNSSFFNTVGVYPPSWRDGTVRFENNYLKTAVRFIFRTSAAPGACPTCDLPDPNTVLNNNRFAAPAGRPLRTISMDWYTNGQDAGNQDRLFACNHGGVAGTHFEVFWPQKANAPCADDPPRRVGWLRVRDCTGGKRLQRHRRHDATHGGGDSPRSERGGVRNGVSGSRRRRRRVWCRRRAIPSRRRGARRRGHDQPVRRAARHPHARQRAPCPDRGGARRGRQRRHLGAGHHGGRQHGGGGAAAVGDVEPVHVHDAGRAGGHGQRRGRSGHDPGRRLRRGAGPGRLPLAADRRAARARAGADCPCRRPADADGAVQLSARRRPARRLCVDRRRDHARDAQPRRSPVADALHHHAVERRPSSPRGARHGPEPARRRDAAAGPSTHTLRGRNDECYSVGLPVALRRPPCATSERCRPPGRRTPLGP